MKTMILAVLAASISFSACHVSLNETTYSMDGAIQKGPFQLGSGIIVQEVDKNLDPTGRMYTTTTKDDFGSFSLASKFSSQFIEVTSEGFYFNECDNVVASAKITLRSYGDLSLGKPINLNVLTTIAHGRIKHLVDEGKEFSQARDQAETELLAVLGFDAFSELHFYEYSLASGGDDAALLLAVSSTLQKGRSVAALSGFIADLGLDFADDGIIADSALITQIRASAESVIVTSVVNNLKGHYANRGKTVNVPDFSDYKAALMTAGGLLSKPVFSLASGTYIEEKTLTISAPSGAVIYYTTDGAAPTRYSNKYNGPITLNYGPTVVYKAIALINNVASEVSTASYSIKKGRNVSNYYCTRPGYYIKYDYTGKINNSGASLSYPLYLIFQKSTQQGGFYASIDASSTSNSGNYLIGSIGVSSVGFSGSSGTYLSQILWRLSRMPAVVIEGESMPIYTSTTDKAKMSAEFLPDWGSYSDVIKVTFDTREYTSTRGLTFDNTIRGTGTVVYAKDVGIVYFELNHTAGTWNESKDTMTAVATGDAPLVSFTGTFTTSGGVPRYGVTISPPVEALSSMGSSIPAESYKKIETDQPFVVKQYAVPGTYSSIWALDSTGTPINPSGTAQYFYFKFMVPSESTVINTGDLKNYLAP